MRKCQRNRYKSVYWWLYIFPTDGWCWSQPNCKNTLKILAAMSVQWSWDLFCLIKSETFISLGKVHLTVNKTLPCAMMKQITKMTKRVKGLGIRETMGGGEEIKIKCQIVFSQSFRPVSHRTRKQSISSAFFFLPAMLRY